MHRFLGGFLIAAALLAGASPAQAAPTDCATGGAEAAATAIYGAGTELVSTADVAGLRTALVAEPYIAPGTRHRLVRTGRFWCSAETALNRVWAAEGRAVGDGRALAAAYAQLAAAPYFDETTITSQVTAGNVHTITTHARTNGITAQWVITTDAKGIAEARWTATGFAVKPFVAQIEGLTALEGATETYTRATGSDLLRAERGLPTSAGMAITAPAATLSYETPDGYSIRIVASDSRQMPDVGQDTGQYEVDKLTLRTVRQAIGENYKEFYGWGLRGAWSAPIMRAVLLQTGQPAPEVPAKTGFVYMNDAVSPYCLACVFIADDFQIHMNQEVEEALGALGYSYPGADPYDVYSDILGHEMFHNWQNNYVKPTSTGRSAHFSYLEGTARFQETLHDYSAISHQNKSLVYANDANGCNGALGSPPDAALAGGVLGGGPTYAACQFWLPWYTSAGQEAFVRLVTEGMPAGTTVPQGGQPLSNSGEIIKGIEVATGRPYIESAAAWARGLITGEGMVYGAPLGTSAPLDWGKFLERWNPAVLDPGESATRSLSNGGIMGVEVSGAFRPSATGGAAIAVIRDTAAGTELSYPAAGETVAGPGAGESVYLIAARTSSTAASVKLSAGTA